MIDQLDARFQRMLSEISFSESGVSEELAAQQAIDCLKLLEVKSFEGRRDELKKRIRDFETQGKIQDALL